LVHVSEISKEKINTPVGMYNVGDNLQVKVINVSSKDRKIGLSIKALDEDSDEGSLKDYKKKQPAGPATIGDLLKEELESKETSSKEEAITAEKVGAPAEQEAAEEPEEEAGSSEAAEIEEETGSSEAAEIEEDEPKTDLDKE
jgi:predicted RNA-binding protein with RPS1 domain